LIQKFPEEYLRFQGFAVARFNRGNDIVPIPGTKRRAYLRDNLAATDVRLTSEEVAELDRDLPAGAAGDRYPAQAMTWLDR